VENELKKLLQDNNVIPFIGAGVSLAVQKSGYTEDNSIFLNWLDLLKTLADGLEEHNEKGKADLIRLSLEHKKNKYLEIADDIKEFYPTTALYYDKLEEILDKKKEEVEDSSLDLARAIWSLGQKLVITTNYDKVMHWASTEPNDTQRWDIQAVSEQASSLSHGVKKETVWHLHGHIENKNNMILTTESYNRLYNDSLDGEFKTAFNTMKIHLATKSFLFIGYSLDDEFFVNELEKINRIFKNQSSTHFILLRKGKKLPKQFNKKIIPIYFEENGQALIKKINDFNVTQFNNSSKLQKDININNSFIQRYKEKSFKVHKDFIFITISGASASGKDNLLELIDSRKNLSDIPIKTLSKFTTRPKRKSDSKYYKFVSENTYKRIQDNDEIIFTYTKRNYRYGFEKSDLIESAQKRIMLFAIFTSFNTLQNDQEFIKYLGINHISILIDADIDSLQIRTDGRLLDDEDKVSRKLSIKEDVLFIKKNKNNINNYFQLIVDNSDNKSKHSSYNEIMDFLNLKKLFI